MAGYGKYNIAFEKRGEVIRLVQTLRGGDRPKGAEQEFGDVSAMPRSAWEPWGLFRKPISEGTVAANLRRWGTGGLRRVSDDEPFRDVIRSSPTRARERVLSPHPSLKPQRFMRQVVRAMLPVGQGLVYDPYRRGRLYSGRRSPARNPLSRDGTGRRVLRLGDHRRPSPIGLRAHADKWRRCRR